MHFQFQVELIHGEERVLGCEDVERTLKFSTHLSRYDAEKCSILMQILVVLEVYKLFTHK